MSNYQRARWVARRRSVAINVVACRPNVVACNDPVVVMEGAISPQSSCVEKERESSSLLSCPIGPTFPVSPSRLAPFLAHQAPSPISSPAPPLLLFGRGFSAPPQNGKKVSLLFVNLTANFKLCRPLLQIKCSFLINKNYKL